MDNELNKNPKDKKIIQTHKLSKDAITNIKSAKNIFLEIKNKFDTYYNIKQPELTLVKTFEDLIDIILSFLDFYRDEIIYINQIIISKNIETLAKIGYFNDTEDKKKKYDKKYVNDFGGMPFHYQVPTLFMIKSIGDITLFIKELDKEINRVSFDNQEKIKNEFKFINEAIKGINKRSFDISSCNEDMKLILMGKRSTIIEGKKVKTIINLIKCFNKNIINKENQDEFCKKLEDSKPEKFLKKLTKKNRVRKEAHNKLCKNTGSIKTKKNLLNTVRSKIKPFVTRKYKIVA